MILIGFGGNLNEVLNKEDKDNTGIISVERLVLIIKERQIEGLQPIDIERIVNYLDTNRFGVIVIANFM